MFSTFASAYMIRWRCLSSPGSSLISRSISSITLARWGDTVMAFKAYHGHFLWGPLIFLRHYTKHQVTQTGRRHWLYLQIQATLAVSRIHRSIKKVLRALFPWTFQCLTHTACFVHYSQFHMSICDNIMAVLTSICINANVFHIYHLMDKKWDCVCKEFHQPEFLSENQLQWKTSWWRARKAGVLGDAHQCVWKGLLEHPLCCCQREQKDLNLI